MKSVSERRRETNRKNLAKFFGNESSVSYTGIYASCDPKSYFNLLSSDEFLKLMNLYLDNRGAVEHILSYARKYKQAARELTIEDVDTVRNLLAVKTVMEE